MHYKTRSAISVSVFLVIMIGLAFTLSAAKQPSVTGAAVGTCDIACRSNTDCYDGNACTVEECVNPFACDARCVVTQVPDCQSR